MNLQDEITRLRAEIESKRVYRKSRDNSAQSLDEPVPKSETEQAEVEAFFAAVNATLEEFAGEIDKYPRLTAISAFGVGLAIGLVIGRRTR